MFSIHLILNIENINAYYSNIEITNMYFIIWPCQFFVCIYKIIFIHVNNNFVLTILSYVNESIFLFRFNGKNYFN